MSVTVRFYSIGVHDVVAFAGGGFYMPWILGAASAIGQRLPRGTYRIAGVSAGAIAAAFLACDVDFSVAVEMILARKNLFHGRLERFGRLRGDLEAWLAIALPDDAARRCAGRLCIILYKVGFGHVVVDEFRDKADLIDAVVASGFLPLYSDLGLAADFRGDKYVDAAAFGERNSYFRGIGRSALVVDHNHDACAVRDFPWYRFGTAKAWARRFQEGRTYADRAL